MPVGPHPSERAVDRKNLSQSGCGRRPLVLTGREDGAENPASARDAGSLYRREGADRLPGKDRIAGERKRRRSPRLPRWTLLLPALAGPAAAEPGGESGLADFVGWLRRASLEERIPGMALAVASRDRVLDMRAWGVSRVTEPEPVTAGSLFRIASISKTFAGAAATLLVDRRLQSWDARVAELFPDLRIGAAGASRAITLRHVASHSTGLMPHAYSNMLDHGIAYDAIKEKLHEVPAVCAPGRCYGYQNVVFSLIGDVVEQSTGEPYDRFVRERIFRPLGMDAASIGHASWLSSPGATSPHRRIRGKWRPVSTNPAYYSVAPASGINAGIEDMGIWLRANLGAFPDVLPPDFLSAMHEPVIATPRGAYYNRWEGLERAWYGIGWRVFDYRGMRVIHHGGGVRGYRSELAFVPGADIGLVVLMNAETDLANDIVPAFLDHLSIRSEGSLHERGD